MCRMMEEKEEIILSKYWKLHISNDIEIAKKSLEEDCRAFLEASNPRDRFNHLDSNFYSCILERIAGSLGTNEDSIHKMKSGFNSLEKFAINLGKFSWRKEFHAIKLYTAFFKTKVELQLQDADAILSILESLGYTKSEQDLELVSVREPSIEQAKRVSFQLFLVQLELQVIKEIMEEIMETSPSIQITLKDIIKSRERTLDKTSTRKYLSAKIAKRRKLDAPVRGDLTSNDDRDEMQDLENRTTLKPVEQAKATTHHSSKEDPDMSHYNNKDEEDVAIPAVSKAVTMCANYKEGSRQRRWMSDTHQLRELSEQELYGAPLIETRQPRPNAHRNASLAPFQTSHSHRSANTFHSLTSNVPGAHLPIRDPSSLYQVRTYLPPDDPQGLKEGVGGQAFNRDSVVLRTHGKAPRDQQGLMLSPQDDEIRAMTTTRVDIGKHRYQVLSTGAGPSRRSSVRDHQQFAGIKYSHLSPAKEIETVGNETSDELTQMPVSVPRNVSLMETNQLQNVSSDKDLRGNVGVKIKENPAVSDLNTDLPHKLKLESDPCGEQIRSNQLSVNGGAAFFVEKDRNSEGARNDPTNAAKTSFLRCNHCELEETQLICQNCLITICEKCKGVHTIDLCPKTKGSHFFKDIKDKSRRKNILDDSSLSDQKVGGSQDEARKEWSCSMCTYLNSPENKICVMCAKSRDFDVIEESKPGSRLLNVCKHCTLINDESLKVCVACHRTLERKTKVTLV
ncbi:uncharacterized protein [Montipora capricornis]|uniref:uncharacterized protein n=1 Tax=Montipora capricornis TaxID=246305 RepID=UPI0035F15BE4